MSTPGADSAPEDLALLRAYEPVVRFTKGEYFYPVSVHNYAKHAALWTELPDGESVIEATPETFDSSMLAAMDEAIPGQSSSLSGIMPDGKSGKVRIPLKDRPPRLSGASRLAAVGLLGRLIDALNRLSLVFRGSVPGGSAAKSFLLQQEHLEPDRPVYYGRVVRDGDWLSASTGSSTRSTTGAQPSAGSTSTSPTGSRSPYSSMAPASSTRQACQPPGGWCSPRTTRPATTCAAAGTTRT